MTNKMKDVLTENLNVKKHKIKEVDVVPSLKLSRLMELNPNRYDVKNNCFNNSAALTNDTEEISGFNYVYVLVYAVRLNQAPTVKALSSHPEYLDLMLPLSTDSYAFAHAIVRDKDNGKYYDPTLQDHNQGLADFYFVARELSNEELQKEIKKNNGFAPKLGLKLD